MAKKIEAIQDAYSQLRISGLTVDPTPEDIQVALHRLESMMSELDVRNICLDYNFEDVPDPDSDTNVIHGFNQMMATNLAVRLIPDFGKEVPITLKAQAAQSMSLAAGYSARERLNQVPYPSRQPIGSANTLRYNWWRRFYRGEKPAQADCNNKKMLIGEIEDYKEDFHTDLKGESIQSFVTDDTNGITVSNTVISNSNILYRVEAVSSSESTYQRVTITITTSSGRVITHFVNFSIQAVERVI